MFSWPNKWEHASFGRNKTSVVLALKNLADLHCTFFMQHQNTKTSTAVKKTLSASEGFQIKIAQCLLKNINAAISRPMSAIEFSIQSVNEICMMSIGNVRSASSDDSSFVHPGRSSFLADVDCHFFLSISVNNIFLPSWANVFLAE